MKKIFILVGILILVTGCFNFYSQGKSDQSELKQTNASQKELEEKKTDHFKNEEKLTTDSQKKEVQKSTEESKLSEQSTNKNEFSKQEVKTPKNINDTSSSQTEKKQEPIIEAKKEEIWDKLGMTKDEYYNKPMFKWERVDFKTMNECLSYGDNYEPYLNGEVLYNCRDVLSTSGNYLGVMFDTEKLN